MDEFHAQDDLNVRITAVCDVFDKHALNGMEVGANLFRKGIGRRDG
jgi:hypothetical protein